MTTRTKVTGWLFAAGVAVATGACALFTEKDTEPSPGDTGSPDSSADGSDEATVLTAPDAGKDAGDAAVSARIVSMSVGFDACVVREDGHVECWGVNYLSSLGIGADAGSFTTSPPSRVLGLDDAAQVSVAATPTACARRRGGEVVCWGWNGGNALGDGLDMSAQSAASTPTPVVGLLDAVDVSVGATEACAVRRDGTIACWGSAVSIGTDAGVPTQPVAISGIGDAVEVRVGKRHACVRRSSGGVACWGANDFGQTGQPIDAGAAPRVPVPAAVGGISTAVQLAAGDASTCARMSDGTVWCWGGNASSELGLPPDAGAVTTPSMVVGIQGSVELGAGSSSFYSRAADGSIRSWGSNRAGQLGSGLDPVTLPRSSSPVLVAGFSDAVAVAGGREGACAVHASQSVACWGDNRASLIDGQAYRPTPVRAVGLSQIYAIAASANGSCAADVNGDVWCWGTNYDGLLGANVADVTYDSVAGASSTPVKVLGLTARALALVAGDSHACALLSGGGVNCWGSSRSHQLNMTGFTDSNPSAMPVPNLPPVGQLASESDITCALDQQGNVWCWGFSYAPAPKQVPGVAPAVQITTGQNFACALMGRPGAIVCWGSNYKGCLGDGTTQYAPHRVSVLNINDAMQITSGDSHTCALRSNGHVSCWGENFSGQLGIGQHDAIDHPFPAEALNVVDAIDVRAGRGGTCIRRMSGAVVCWGSGMKAGNATGFAKSYVDAPDKPVEGLLAQAVALGPLHACAIANDRSVVCWGSDDLGRLGDGKTLFFSTPTPIAGF